MKLRSRLKKQHQWQYYTRLHWAAIKRQSRNLAQITRSYGRYFQSLYQKIVKIMENNSDQPPRILFSFPLFSQRFWVDRPVWTSFIFILVVYLLSDFSNLPFILKNSIAMSDLFLSIEDQIIKIVSKKTCLFFIIIVIL